MCDWWGVSHGEDEAKQYPWTALGYAFDWSSNWGIGSSEFVIRKGSEIRYESVTPVTAYCAPSASEP
jgi:hypothetical protein